MSDTSVRISRIQRFCTHDGPGVRTTVFLKGCPLRCVWCHNPETRSASPGIMFSDKLCVCCAACESACNAGVHTVKAAHVFDATLCKGCGACAGVCPTGALEMDSTLMTTEQVMKEVLKDRPFYKNTGGLTLSGGEPMFQSNACIELLKSAKAAGITTALETCGYFDSAYLPDLATFTDTFLWDYKLTDPEAHRKYTGHSNALILKNLRMLDKYPVDIRLRCIMMEGVNMTPEHAAGIASLFSSLEHLIDVELLPYHAYGTSKAVQAGISVEPHREWIPKDDSIETFSRMLASMGVKLHVR